MKLPTSLAALPPRHLALSSEQLARQPAVFTSLLKFLTLHPARQIWAFRSQPPHHGTVAATATSNKITAPIFFNLDPLACHIQANEKKTADLAREISGIRLAAYQFFKNLTGDQYAGQNCNADKDAVRTAAPEHSIKCKKKEETNSHQAKRLRHQVTHVAFSNKLMPYAYYYYQLSA